VRRKTATLRGKKTLSEALNQALELEAANIAAKTPPPWQEETTDSISAAERIAPTKLTKTTNTRYEITDDRGTNGASEK
jgi:hypothetical protein